MKTIYHVFVSSTYLDLKNERRAVSEAIAKAGYVAEGMEIFPASSQKQMDFIRSVIDRCDYYILIVGGIYGSMFDDDISFTEAEFTYALEQRIPILSFMRSDLQNVPSKFVETDEDKKQKLELFKERIKKNSVIDFWTAPDELAKNALAALAQEVNRSPGVGWVRGNAVANETMYAELEALRQANETLQRDLQNMSDQETAPQDSALVLSPDQKFRVRYQSDRHRVNALGSLLTGGYGASVVISPRDALIGTAHSYRSPNSIEPLKRFIEDRANPVSSLTSRRVAHFVNLDKEDVDVVAMALTSLGFWHQAGDNFQLTDEGQRFFVESNIVQPSSSK